SRQHNRQRERGRYVAVGTAATRLIDDDLDVCPELATLVDQLDVEWNPATDAARAIEARAHIHTHGAGIGSVLPIGCGRDRLRASYKEQARNQDDRDQGAHRSS